MSKSLFKLGAGGNAAVSLAAAIRPPQAYVDNIQQFVPNGSTTATLAPYGVTYVDPELIRLYAISQTAVTTINGIVDFVSGANERNSPNNLTQANVDAIWAEAASDANYFGGLFMAAPGIPGPTPISIFAAAVIDVQIFDVPEPVDAVITVLRSDDGEIFSLRLVAGQPISNLEGIFGPSGGTVNIGTADAPFTKEQIVEAIMGVTGIQDGFSNNGGGSISFLILDSAQLPVALFSAGTTGVLEGVLSNTGTLGILNANLQAFIDANRSGSYNDPTGEPVSFTAV